MHKGQKLPVLFPNWDVAVFRWSQISFNIDGEMSNDFLLPPDWTIEILSPEPSSNRVNGNILYC